MMNYFTTVLSGQAHTLRLPDSLKDDIERFVLQHQKGNASAERAPFRRQLDFWALALTVAVKRGMPPLDRPSSTWGKKFADTRSVQMPDTLCDLIAVLGIAYLGSDAEEIDDPAELIELANKLAGAGAPVLLNELRSPTLRLTTLEKALGFAASVLTEPDQ